jgi:hypothetical protein
MRINKSFTMKYTAIYLFTALAAISLLSSCKKDKEIENANQVGSSKIIYFPSIAINGDAVYMVQPGQTFTDPGAVAILNGDTVKYTTTGGPVGTAPGIYNLTYTAVNAQGYSASDIRSVVVLDPSVLANDFSGTYTRTTGVPSTWTKIGPGEYTVENPGGAAGVAGTVIAVNYNADDIAIPLQNSSIGLTSSTGEMTTVVAGVLTSYTWVIINAGYGTGARTFNK